MESSSPKIWINILIVIAIVLIGVSIVAVIIKKPVESPQVAAPVVVEPVATTTETLPTSTTTESLDVSTSTATSTSAVSTSTASKSLVGKKWTWVKTDWNTGSSTLPSKPSAFTVTFDKDGKVSGTTDCNSFSGTYTSTSSKITFGPLASTKMFCDGSQESQFTGSFSAIASYTMDQKNNLVFTFKADSGTMVFK